MEPNRFPLLYVLKARLLEGPITDAFKAANPVVSRTIEIRADQTLMQLHKCLFAAFDRWEEHLHEFQFGAKKPMARSARVFTCPVPGESMIDDFGKPLGSTKKASIGSMQLTKGESFFYWFDFGDDWWHTIKVMRIDSADPAVKYPRVVASVGASPPQYYQDDPDWVDPEDIDDFVL